MSNPVPEKPLSSHEEKSLEKEKARQLLKQRQRIYAEMKAQEAKAKKAKKVAPEGAFVSLCHLNKIYPNYVQAVYDFTMDIKSKEFIVLVGPSGCGKSTTLRMIAGLEDITAGSLFIDKVYANDLMPKDRDIAMVFQNYALYPHLSVAQNMAFGLKIRKVPTLRVDEKGQPVLGINHKAIKTLENELKNYRDYRQENLATLSSEALAKIDKDIEEDEAKKRYLEATPVEIYDGKHLPKEEIDRRVKDAAKILQIEDYLNRKPKELSGGQCQRVALGRAIVRNAKLFLMDEPLSNLDAKLRVQMRSEIVKLHNALGATTIYVTHDQTEAMTMATRMVVMNRGHVQQIGTPSEIYNHPANLFVASFIGSPAINAYRGSYSAGKVSLGETEPLTLLPAQKKAVESFFASALSKAQEALIAFDAAFLERKECLSHLEEAKLSSRPEAIEKAKKELAICELSSLERQEILRQIAAYEAIEKADKKPLVFGIRPEDIYLASDKYAADLKMSAPIRGSISVSELLGNEYFIHLDYAGKDLVSKIRSKDPLKAGEEVELCFDKEKIHLFDDVSQKIIW